MQLDGKLRKMNVNRSLRSTRIGIIRELHTCAPHTRIRVRYTGTATPVAIARRGTARRVSVSSGLCSPASTVGRAPTDAARNRLGSMSPSCAGDSMPGSFYFAVSSRRPSHAFHRRKRRRAVLRYVHSVNRFSYFAIIT
jgi:hypothetical protein